VRVGGAAQISNKTERTGPRLGAIGGAIFTLLLLAGSGYWAYQSWKAPAPPAPEDSELARKIRQAREGRARQPEVVYVPVPVGQPPKGNAPTWALPSPGQPSLPPLGAGSFEALSAGDRQVAEALAAKLIAGTTPSPSDVVQAEGLYARNGRAPMVGQLLKSLAVRAADSFIAQRNFPQARQILERSVSLLPNDQDLARVLMRAVFEMADWPAAEAIARQIIGREPAAPDGRTVLALAIAAQGNDREALRAIYSALEVVSSGPDEANLRQLRDQIERRLWATSNCSTGQLPDPAHGGAATERLERFLAILSTCGGGPSQRLAHFSVSFKRLGNDVLYEELRIKFSSVDSVSRDLLRILEHHYSTLETTLDHKMRRTIPVVILQDAQFGVVTGAPSWSGGQFDDEDGTITIPLGILDRLAFTDPEEQRKWEAEKGHWLETVLIHETSHAFIEEMSGGMAPRDLHEGLAKFFEREVTRDRRDLFIVLQENVRAQAVRRYPDSVEAQRRFETALLGKLFEEIRTAGARHAATLTSVYTGGELFAEYLVRQRSMGGIQDLLKAMAEKRNVDAAFEQVYGRPYDAMRRTWLDWLRSQWGVGDAHR